MNDVDYFLRKFEAIPEDLWCVRYYKNSFGQHCSLGHCGVSIGMAVTPEADALESLFALSGLVVAYVNDGIDDHFPQSTPKARILAALELIKSQTKS